MNIKLFVYREEEQSYIELQTMISCNLKLNNNLLDAQNINDDISNWQQLESYIYKKSLILNIKAINLTKEQDVVMRSASFSGQEVKIKVIYNGNYEIIGEFLVDEYRVFIESNDIVYCYYDLINKSNVFFVTL